MRDYNQLTKPSLPSLTCLSDAPRALTRDERIDALLREDAEVKAQIDRLNQKRADLKELIKAQGEDAFERWYFQEHGEDMAELRRKEAARRERRAAIEERQRMTEERRARLSPEALAKLRASIADVKESTKEELRHEATLAQIKEKQERREWRRWRNGNGASNDLES